MTGATDADDRRALTEVVSILQPMVGRPLERSAVEFLERHVEQLSFLDPDQLQVVLAGPFNAGKSSIINALAETDLAAVDCFRKTRWEARYWKASVQHCRLHRRDGSSEAVPLGDFLHACESGEGPLLRDLDHVSIEDPRMLDGIALVDAPGIGAGKHDEQTAQQALGRADLVLFVFDATHIGDVADMALAAELLRLDLPVLIAFNKCDHLDADEVEEVRTYLTARLDVVADSVLETSTLEPAGVAGLRSRLQAAVPLASEVRVKAARAHRRATLELAGELTAAAQDQYLEFTHQRDALANQIGTIRTVVEQTLAAEVTQLVRTEVFQGQRDRIAEALTAALLKHPEGMSDSDVLAVLNHAVPNARTSDQTIKLVVDFAGRRASELWGERTQSATEQPQLANALREMRAIDLRLTTTSTGSPDQVFGTGATVSIAIGATMAAYVATLGPAAAAVTAGMAVSGVGLPIAAVGILVSWGLRSLKKGQQAQKATVVVNQMLDRCEHAIVETVENELLPPLATHHRAVEQRILALATQGLQEDLLPPGDPDALGASLRVAGTTVARLWDRHDGTRWSAPLDGRSMPGASVTSFAP